MPVRSILIFPEFADGALIDEIRRRYDPLVDAIRPHITLAFPFDSALSDDALAGELQRAVQGVPPFELQLRGFSRQSDPFGHYLFLNVARGGEVIRRLHNALYAGALQEFDLGYPYIPHMTVGRLPDTAALEAAYRSLCQRDVLLTTCVRKISIERIGANEESIIVYEQLLES